MKAFVNPLSKEQQRRLAQKLRHEEETRERFRTVRQFAFTCIALNRRRRYGRLRLCILGEDIAQVATELLAWGEINNDVLVKEMRRLKLFETADELEQLATELRAIGGYKDA